MVKFSRKIPFRVHLLMDQQTNKQTNEVLHKEVVNITTMLQWDCCYESVMLQKQTQNHTVLF